MKVLNTISICLALLCLALPARPQDGGPRSAVELVVQPGEASATPCKKGVAYANGGVIAVAQPNPTTLVTSTV